MSRPLQFPNPFSRIVWLFFLLFVLPITLFVGSNIWLSQTLGPLQKQYFGPYWQSSLAAGGRNATTTVRWIDMTAPGRKPEPAAVDDVVDGPHLKLPLQLSPAAQAQGWRGLRWSAPERIPSERLAPYLRENVFGGVSASMLFAKPMLYVIAGFLLLWGVWAQTKLGWRSAKATRAERRHGRRTKGPELLRARFSRREEGIRLKLEGSRPFSGWVPMPAPSFCIPKRLESSHILLMGDTGAGKSSAIRQILQQVEARGETAIVYDPAMDFVAQFYNEKRGDLILNPLDARCPHWKIADEIVRDEIATTIAAAFLPDKEYEKAFFTDAPRRLLAAMLLRRLPTHFLLRWMSEPEVLASIIAGTPLAALIDPAAPAQRAGVLSSLNLVADSLELLPEVEPGRQKFSTAEWTKERKRWVFLTSSPAYREKVRPLHSVWLDLFILRMQGGCEDPNTKPVWFVIDELASLNKLPQLHTAVTENRKHGNPVVLAMQGRSQMEKRYGQDAETMLSQPATKIFFKTSEPRAAKWISESIGEIEVERLKESRSMEALAARQSFAMEIATKPLVMASEIAGLAPLHAFIKQENRVVPVHFRFMRARGLGRQFIERVLPPREPRPGLKEAPQPIALEPISEPVEVPKPRPKLVKAAPTAGASVVAKAKVMQKDLPLAPAMPKASQPAFVWDETQGID